MGDNYEKLHVVFWGREGSTTCIFGYNGAGMPAATTVAHQPFNPSKSMSMPIIKIGEEVIKDASSLYPLIITDTLKEPVEITFPDFYFKDPFLLLCVFTKKAETGATNWGDGKTGTITADFSTEDHNDSIMVQYRLYDKNGNHIDWTCHGGEITQYQWVAEKGKLLMEKITVKFMNMVSNTRAFTSDGDFDDNKTRPNANWDEDAPFHSKNVSYEWGGSAVAALTIQKGTLTIKVGRSQEHDQSSQVVSIHYVDNLDFDVVLEGVMTNKTQFDELQNAYVSKTKQTFEMIYNDAGGTEERKIQCTQVYLKGFEFDGDAIPESGKPIKCKLTFGVGVANDGTEASISFSGKWTDHVDPYAATARRINVDTR